MNQDYINWYVPPLWLYRLKILLGILFPIRSCLKILKACKTV